MNTKNLCLAALSILAASAVQAQTTLTGAGATFPNPIYQKWFEEYHKADGSVTINYQPIGSGGGKAQITAKTVDFGASDGPMSDEELGKASGKILHLPTVAGAVVITYNVPNAGVLKLDGPTLAGVFSGKITKWDDKVIASQNAGTKLPSLDITVVHRSDASGTNYIFTDYLSAVSPEWMSSPGKGTSVSWPVGLGAKGNDGIAQQIKDTPGAIGYVELIYAVQQKLTYATLKNADGEYVKASPQAVTAALATAKIPDDFRFSMVNAPGKAAYPISGATWLLVYEDQADATKGKALVAFLKWALTTGEKAAPTLAYAPLPEAVQKQVLARIDTIKTK